MEQRVFTYLHNSARKVVPYERVNEEMIQLDLPSGECIEIELNSKDRRIPLIIDGLLLLGGISKRSRFQILDEFEISISQTQMRKKPDYVTVHPYYYASGKNSKHMCVCVQRIFALLPAGLSVFMKFRAESLSPVYVMAETTITEKGGSITFRTTAY